MGRTLFGRSIPTLHRDGAPRSSGQRPGGRVLAVHRVGAVVTALVLVAFGTLGLSGGLAFFSTQGRSVAGLSSNGLLSAVSLVTALVLVAAAVRGGRSASTVLIVVGALFLVSAFVNLALLGTVLNVLAFRLPNVFFSIGAGLVLLLTGAYGRVSGGLHDDNPYRSSRAEADSREALVLPAQPTPATAAEAAADRDMAAAELAVVQGVADPEQAAGVDDMSGMRTHEDRRTIWMRRAH